MNKFKLYIEEHKESIIILITILQVISLVFFSGIKKQEHKNEVIVTKPMLISYSEIAKELNKRYRSYGNRKLRRKLEYKN